MAEVPKSERVKLATKASKAAAEVVKLAVEERYRAWGVAAYRSVYSIMSGARDRCTNEKNISWSGYGGRGIGFGFPDLRSATEWVLNNLGANPDGMSIDRIDNNRGYEPGNLRWATRSEQARNKRAYRGKVYGRRLADLRELRPDLTYETLRTWINKGLSDEDILKRRKYKQC